MPNTNLLLYTLKIDGQKSDIMYIIHPLLNNLLQDGEIDYKMWKSLAKDQVKYKYLL